MSIGAILLWLVFLLILALPGWLIEKGLKRAIDRQQKARAWPVVDGVVSGVSIEERKRSLSGRDIFGNPRKITVYLPVIQYSYEVGNKPFEGSRYKNAFAGEWTDPNRSKVDKILEAYPAGTLVKVHYDPADPAQAYLELEKSEANLIFLRLFGWAMLAGALVVLVVGLVNFAKGIGAKVGSAGLDKSAAVLPVSTTQIKTRLEGELGFACQPEAYSGMHVAYFGWNCAKAAGGEFPEVEIWSRKSDPEKTDQIWVIMDQENPEDNKALLQAVIPLIFSGADAISAQDWCLGLLSTGLPIRQESTPIQGIHLFLNNPSEFRLHLIIGSSK